MGLHCKRTQLISHSYRSHAAGERNKSRYCIWGQLPGRQIHSILSLIEIQCGRTCVHIFMYAETRTRERERGRGRHPETVFYAEQQTCSCPYGSLHSSSPTQLATVVAPILDYSISASHTSREEWRRMRVSQGCPMPGVPFGSTGRSALSEEPKSWRSSNVVQ